MEMFLRLEAILVYQEFNLIARFATSLVLGPLFSLIFYGCSCGLMIEPRRTDRIFSRSLPLVGLESPTAVFHRVERSKLIIVSVMNGCSVFWREEVPCVTKACSKTLSD